MKRVAILAAMTMALFTAAAVGPGRAVADGCAAGFGLVADAQACGGEKVLHSVYFNAPYNFWHCTYRIGNPPTYVEEHYWAGQWSYCP